MWKHEPMDCYLQVIDVKNDALGALCDLQCVNDCDLHMAPRITRDDYELYYDELGDDLFLFASSMQDIGKLYEPKDIHHSIDLGYDFVLDSVDIFRQVVTGTLPVYKKNAHVLKKGKRYG
jgi:hypothetical protein